MAWIYLIAAGLFEVGWPVGLKWAQLPDKIIVGIIVAIVCMAVSGCLLFMAQKEIALGTPPGSGPTSAHYAGRRVSPAGVRPRRMPASTVRYKLKNDF